MRINKFLASHSHLSRRQADEAIASGRVTVNGKPAALGDDINTRDTVSLDGRQLIHQRLAAVTILLNKPVGYVCSHNGQGSPTVYDLLPEEYRQLNIAGRLDKDSSGLILLTNDGDLLYGLTHPSRRKIKRYEVTLNKPLDPGHYDKITNQGVLLDDGLSRFDLQWPDDNDARNWIVIMHEGRNRQIRRTFKAVGYRVTRLQRTSLGDYKLDGLDEGAHKIV